MTADATPLLAGVVVPVVTTMDRDREPDAQQMHGVLDELSAAGVRTLMLYGSNGEGPVLGTDEVGSFARSMRLQWEKRAPGGAVLVNVSGSSTAETLRRAEAVSVAEPTALIVSPPMYFRHTPREIVAHYRAFAGLGVPVVAYNSPRYTGNDLTVEVMRDVLELEHVVGIKDSSGVEGRVAELVGIAAERPGFGVNQGDEGRLLEGLEAGAVGVTPGIANLAPRIPLELYAAFTAGDLDRARELDDRARELAGMHRAVRPGVATMKAALAIRGVCLPFASSPFEEYSDDETSRLRAFLEPWSEDIVGHA